MDKDAGNLRATRPTPLRLEKECIEMGDEAGLNCDWHDNFGYEDARRRFEQESSKLSQLKELVSNPTFITPIEQNEKVLIGTTVFYYLDSEKQESTIGAEFESMPEQGLISYRVPIAKGLVGMLVGDIRSINIAGNEREIEVAEIYPPSHKYHSFDIVV